MDAISRIITVLLVPLGVMNMLGGLISGIWLAFLGHWALIGYGLLIIAFASFGIGFAMMPSLLFAVPAMSLLNKGNKFFGYIFLLLSTLYTYVILTLWCLLILAYYMNQVDNDSIIPVLIWSYGVATGPIGFIAQKEQNEYSMISTFFIQVAFLISIISIYFIGLTFLSLLILFGITMSIGLLIQFSLAFLMEK